MEDLTPFSKQPEFNSLTEIMERFHHVPYEQFQKELHDWFMSNLLSKGEDLNDLQKEGLPDLPSFISEIYHRAEVLQALSDYQINRKDGED
jgi:hypothetical protein